MAIRGDAFERRVFMICRRDTRWQVFDGDTLLADCAYFDLASAAASRLAREAFNAGSPVRIATEHG